MKETAMRTAIGVVEQKNQAREQQRRKRRLQVYRRKLVLSAAVLFLCIHAGGLMMMNAFADEPHAPEKDACYTCIRIEPGDSLWSIASRYAVDSPMDTRQYVKELMRINRLADETIHAGNYLTVVYYE